MPTKVAVIYYSSTGNVHKLAKAVAEGAKEVGAEVRLRKAAELAPREAIEANPAWAKHVEETGDVPEAASDDLLWADSYIFGTPTRFGNVSAQLKQFIDAQGPLWAEGKLADKAVGVFTSAGNEHGGQESTILSLYNVVAHWGSIIVPMGYTADEIFASGGNPYGVSSSDGGDEGPGEEVLAAARYQGRRTAEKAAALSGSRVG